MAPPPSSAAPRSPVRIQAEGLLPRTFATLLELHRLPRAIWRLGWALWVGVIVCATTVYGNVFVGHSHWELVQWIPTKGTGTWAEYAADVLANIVLFAPLGYAQRPAGLLPARLAQAGKGLLYIGLTALALSMAVELVQVYSHNRQGSTSDLMANTLGGLLGGYLYAHYAKILSAR